ncbi:hypothetical protein FJU30_26460 [Affinibrenneria salicis]|uniref:Uncharacterized protein n=1 Tax=Affinibrenneria salicis TaxID=2590031 RepID=A0A5J5FPQ4_9GAMM|nr:hypothetical protein [Affinibrenneria salicis]KAA8993832.1 hypothetical protein FJU30_26460 [Affinibrenneria salicis]
MMGETDFTLHNVQMLLTRNKSKQWQEEIIKSSTVLLGFLKNNGLLVGVDPFDEQGELKTDTVIKMSNITEDGLALFKNTVDGWYNYLARSTAPDKYENISRLEKGLAKIRGK